MVPELGLGVEIWSINQPMQSWSTGWMKRNKGSITWAIIGYKQDLSPHVG